MKDFFFLYIIEYIKVGCGRKVVVGLGWKGSGSRKGRLFRVRSSVIYIESVVFFG